MKRHGWQWKWHEFGHKATLEMTWVTTKMIWGGIPKNIGSNKKDTGGIEKDTYEDDGIWGVTSIMCTIIFYYHICT